MAIDFLEAKHLGAMCNYCYTDYAEATSQGPDVKTVGVSNYQAEIYLDLESKWVRKLDLVLFEITSTTMWGIPVDKSIPVTKLTIRAIDETEFGQD